MDDFENAALAERNPPVRRHGVGNGRDKVARILGRRLGAVCATAGREIRRGNIVANRNAWPTEIARPVGWSRAGDRRRPIPRPRRSTNPQRLKGRKAIIVAPVAERTHDVGILIGLCTRSSTGFRRAAGLVLALTAPGVSREATLA